MSVADRSLARAQIASPARIPPWISPAVVFVVAAAATFAIILFLAIRQETPQPQTQRVVPQNVRLALHVEGQGDRLLLSWDRQIVTSAIGAVLHIQDGTANRDIHLDAGQVANGLISYKPLSNDVSFRLEVQTGQSLIDASLRVLDGTKMVSALPGPVVFRPVHSGVSNAESPMTVSPTQVPSGPASSDVTGTHERTVDQQITAHMPPVTSSGMTPPSIETSVSMPPGTLPAFVGVESAATSVKPPAPPENPHITPGSEGLGKAAVPSGTVGIPPVTKPAAVPSTHSVYAPPLALVRVMPNVDAAWPVSISAPAQIQILVRIDRRGRVKTAEVLAEKGKVQSALVAVAVVAARGWKFRPAALDGKPIESEHIIVFDFHPPR